MRTKLHMEDVNALQIKIVDLVSDEFESRGDSRLTTEEEDELLEVVEDITEKLAGYPDYRKHM